ncbi:MAG: hypothetical protein JW908_06190 [Anaerolineales bacterium]|nr:hypothetical protein [Anaerolineales bacterium]
MTKDNFEIPDMDEFAKQMEDAMSEAKKALEDLPMQMEGMGDLMGSLSAMMDGLPGDMDDLSNAMTGFEEQHAANVESVVGEPDWALEANIRVGKKLHVLVRAVFDFQKIREAWESTKTKGFESLIEETVTANAGEMEPGIMDQIMSQLKQGRSMAAVKDIKVLACRIQGAPANATETIKLSPEGNIPLVMNEKGVGFEFAPLLTIRNRWENANIPAFVPMGDQIVVGMNYFEKGEIFNVRFKPDNQEEAMEVELSFSPLS